LEKKHYNVGNRYAAKGDHNADAFIHARCTKKDKAAWIAKASSEGMKLTTWIIKTMNEELTRVENVHLGGWINANEVQPPLIENLDQSANVWGWDGYKIMVVALFVDPDGWYWANAYGNVFCDAEYDDEYDIKYWQPIAIPTPPNHTENAGATIRQPISMLNSKLMEKTDEDNICF